MKSVKGITHHSDDLSGFILEKQEEKRRYKVRLYFNRDCALDGPKHGISNHPWPLLIQGGGNY